jgi:uncharacterized protein involved in exopolysaccharide biosynthesis
MQEQQHITYTDDEIDLRELFGAICAGKWLILFVTSIFTIGSVIYALQLPDIYKSEVILAPTEDGGLKVPGQLGGLAALAGVNLGSSTGGDKISLALEILKSRDFIGRFIEKNDLYLPIMAATGWNRADNQLILDADIYNINTQQWVRQVQTPFQPEPSNQETVEEFKKLFSVSQDKNSGMIKISVEHFSPYLANNWVRSLVNGINEEIRARELNEAERSIVFLNQQIEKTKLSDVRAMLFSLIEEQTKTLMLANVRDEYVFKIVDPSVVAERKVKPARSVICIIGLILGVIISMLVVIFRYISNKESGKEI